VGRARGLGGGLGRLDLTCVRWLVGVGRLGVVKDAEAEAKADAEADSIFLKLPLYVIIHYNGTTKQLLSRSASSR
jgi:hypothetical protein